MADNKREEMVLPRTLDNRNKVSRDALNVDTAVLASYPETTTTITQEDADKINELQRILILLINQTKQS